MKTYKILVGEEWIIGVPIIGELCREMKLIGTDAEHYAEYIYTEPMPRDVFFLDNVSIQVNNNPALGLGNVFYANKGDEVELSVDLVDESNSLQVQLDSTLLGYPPILKLPMVKVVDNAQLIDDIYLTTTLVAGQMVSTGIIPSSGNWKLQEARINKSIAAIGADWAVEMNDITFLV